MPWLLDLQFISEENVHNETFDDVLSRVFIALRDMGWISLPKGGEWEILLVILTILTFSKANKQLSVNIEHQLKSKLTWPACKKSMKFK